MPENVLIFCDGTGQVGGIHFDEFRTNVYKMYRAMRCGPDSTINPAMQVAFYDPGIGSQSDGGHLFGRLARHVYNLVAQATGFGITRNIVDCYAAVTRLWEPGDRIWLFGFSRGAYTARCVAEVIALCGIPRRTTDGTALKLNEGTVRKVANYAVKHVYQFAAPRPPGTGGDRQARLEAARLRLAETFRAENASRHDVADGTYPYFVGVFDTVAALINPLEAVALGAIVVVVSSIMAALAAFVFGPFGSRLWAFFLALAIILISVGIMSAAVYVWTHFKVDYASGWQGWHDTWHFTDFYPKFYDQDLDPNIGYAKHAISLDENRAAFQRVPWGHGRKHPTDDPAGRPFFEQVWFAGNHADIGGGYSENESRLSDIALDWMLSCACEVPGTLQFDPSVLRRWPSADGPQHDEVAIGFGWLTSMFHWTWPEAPRSLPGGRIELHPTVYDRFEAGLVMHWNGLSPYQPMPLAAYPDVVDFYGANVPAGIKAKRDSLARRPAPPGAVPSAQESLASAEAAPPPWQRQAP